MGVRRMVFVGILMKWKFFVVFDVSMIFVGGLKCKVIFLLIWWLGYVLLRMIFMVV